MGFSSWLRSLVGCAAHFMVCVTPSWVWAHGAYHEVIASLGQELQKEPGNAELHFRMAVACQEHGEWVEALGSLDRAEQLAPGKYPVGFVQGQALATGGLWQPAKSALDYFLAAHPQNSAALAQRGRVLLTLKQPQEALADFRAALVYARHPEADLFVEVADALAAHGTRAEAVEVMRRGIERLGNIPALLQRAVELEVAEGQFDTALGHLDAMKAAAPSPEPWMAQRARLLASAGRREEARAAWSGLRDHLKALPNLQRGTPEMNRLLQEALAALGEQAPAAAHAPPVRSAPLRKS